MLLDGNVGIVNHIVHFILGIISYRFHYVTGLFLIYQFVDGLKFHFKVVRDGKVTDDIPLDLLFFSLGELSGRLFHFLKN
jgi:hypothetical protein